MMQHQGDSLSSNSREASSPSSTTSSIHSDYSSTSPYSGHTFYRQEFPDPGLQRLFDQMLSNVTPKVEEVSDFLHRYSQFIDINAYDEEGQTPLQRSVLNGSLPLVKLLIQYGANPGMTNREGWSPVHIASFSGNTELYSYIVRCNARILKR